MLGVTERSWSTDEHRADERFRAWQSAASATFVPVAITQDAPAETFRSRVQGRRLGDLALSWLDSDPQVVDRPAGLIRRRPGGVYFVNLPLAGRGVVTQDGRRSLTRAGDLVLVDGDRPFRLEFAGRFEQLSLAVPHALLDPLLADPAAATAVTIPGHRGVGAVASAALTAAARQRGRLDARQTLGLVRHLVGLLALSLADAQAARGGGRAALLQAALDEIEARLPDPDLDIRQAAAAACISTSYLTKLFAERGTTFGRFVLGRRLERAWSALDPTLPGPPGTVTGVALAAGFRDSAHFARTFRARFGITPTQRLAGAPALQPGRDRSKPGSTQPPL